jgi:ankyrin repeat protein
MVFLVRWGFVNPTDPPVKQLICYFFFGVMMIVFVLLLVLLGSGFVGGCKAEFCQFAKISFLIYSVIATIVILVLGKYVLVHAQDPFSVGILLGFFIIMSFNMFGSGVLFSANLPNKVWMPFIYGGHAREHISHETDDAFSAFSFFLCILYTLFSWILYNWRYMLVFEGQSSLEYQDSSGSDRSLFLANNPGGAKKDRLSSPKYQMVIPQIAEDNEAVLQQWLRDSTTHINDTSEDKGQTALMLACRHGAVNCALLLLSSGANANLRMNADGSGGTALYICAQMGHKQILEFLIRFHANLNAPILTGATPCFIAAKKGHLDCLEMLVDAGADVNACTRSGGGPLHMAAYHGNMEELSLLLKTRAVVDLPMKGEITALFLAVQQGHARAAKALLTSGADPNYARAVGDTCIFVATHHEQIDMLKLLLDHKADPNHAGPDGANVVHLAVDHGNHTCLEMLLRAKADPNKQMVDGATPLFIAAQDTHEKVTPKIIDLLCQFDAHVDKARSDGLTPFQTAIRCGNTSLADALQRQGASTVMPSTQTKHRKSTLADGYGKRTISIDFNRSAQGGLAMIRGMSTWSSSSRSETVDSTTGGYSDPNPLYTSAQSRGGNKPPPPSMQTWSSAKQGDEVGGVGSKDNGAGQAQEEEEEGDNPVAVKTVQETLKKHNTNVLISRTTAEI